MTKYFALFAIAAAVTAVVFGLSSAEATGWVTCDWNSPAAVSKTLSLFSLSLC